MGNRVSANRHTCTSGTARWIRTDGPISSPRALYAVHGGVGVVGRVCGGGVGWQRGVLGVSVGGGEWGRREVGLVLMLVFVVGGAGWGWWGRGRGVGSIGRVGAYIGVGVGVSIDGDVDVGVGIRVPVVLCESLLTNKAGARNFRRYAHRSVAELNPHHFISGPFSASRDKTF